MSLQSEGFKLLHTQKSSEKYYTIHDWKNILFLVVYYCIKYSNLQAILFSFCLLFSFEASEGLWGPERRARWDPAGTSRNQRHETEPTLGAFHRSFSALAAHLCRHHQQRHAALWEWLGKNCQDLWLKTSIVKLVDGLCLEMCWCYDLYGWVELSLQHRSRIGCLFWPKCPFISLWWLEISGDSSAVCALNGFNLTSLQQKMLINYSWV